MMQVTPTLNWTYLIHEAGQRPVEGVAVWRYSWGWKCERDGATDPNDAPGLPPYREGA